MNNKPIRPPRLAAWILRRTAVPEERFPIAQNLDEDFREYLSHKGKFKARAMYRHHALKAILTILCYKAYWSIVMFMKYFKMTFRQMKKYKGYSLINTAGLCIGMTVSILILFYVQYELSYDHFHQDAGSIYRLIKKNPESYFQSQWMTSTWPALAPSLKRDFPEVLRATRLQNAGEFLLKYNNQHYLENNIYYVDPDFLEIFTFPLISGDPQTALNEPFSLLITEKTAKKYFGGEEPIGKILHTRNYVYKITGLLKNIPENSYFNFDFLLSYNTKFTLYRDREAKDQVESWGYSVGSTFIKLKNDFNPDTLENKFPAYLKRKLGDDKSENRSELALQPLSRIHLHGSVAWDSDTTSDIRYIYLFSAIAFLIMLIACLNYMNLSVARSIKRAREVGIRKIIGAKKTQLVTQFIGESIIYSLTALAISILSVKLILQAFNAFVDRNLSFGLQNGMLLYLAGIAVGIGILSGSYPAFFLSSFHPINIIKGTLKTGIKVSSLSKNILVVVQFVISIVMIVCTLIINSQLVYIKRMNLGFNKDQIITILMRDNNLRRNFEPLKNELLKHPSISNISLSSALPSTISSMRNYYFDREDKDKKLEIIFAVVDDNFFDLYSLELIKGRKFSPEFTTDQAQALIINETAAKIIGLEEPVGKRHIFDSDDYEYEIIGVVKDFHFKPLHQEIEPLFMTMNQNRTWAGYVSIKVNPENIPKTLDFIEKKFKEFSPQYPFSYSFLDESIDAKYQSEQKVGQIFNSFTLIAVFTACLGLLGLASFASEQRTKEIGIRKVVGASASKIFALLSKDFFKWILAANIIAWPISYFAMNQWLQNFAYRIHIGIWMFLLAALFALVIVMMTISYTVIKAAKANPADSLRYE